MCVDHTMGITTIPKNGMLGVTEVSYHFWYDIHTSFFTVHGYMYTLKTEALFTLLHFTPVSVQNYGPTHALWSE